MPIASSRHLALRCARVTLLGLALTVAALTMGSCNEPKPVAFSRKISVKPEEVVLFAYGFRVLETPARVRFRVDLESGYPFNASIMPRPKRDEKPTEASYKRAYETILSTRSVTLDVTLEPGVYEALVTPTRRESSHTIRVRFDLQPI